ncbi:MAG: flippase-like domain-containing protein [Nanoarchaeota archaeon]|nr:flippase-like domain-containing protein [Nanoarchaeota archaeon]
MQSVFKLLETLAGKVEKRRKQVHASVKDALSKFRFTLKSVIFTIVSVIIITLIFLNFSQLQKILALLSEANWFFIALALLSQTMTYVCAASIYRSALKIMGAVVDTLHLFKIAIVMLFLNQALPSMGTSGNAFLFSSLNKRGISSGKSTLAVLLALFCYIAGVILMVTIAFMYLIIVSSLTRRTVTGLIAFLGFIIFVVFVVFFILGNRSRMLSILLFFRKWVKKLLRKDISDMEMLTFVEDLYAGFKILKKKPSFFLKPFFFQALLFGFDGLTIYLLFRAFGFVPEAGVVLVGYAIATLFYIISFTPGGLGTFEASMVLAFTQLAVPLEIALVVTLLFRGIAFWLPLPFGLYLFRKLSVGK